MAKKILVPVFPSEWFYDACVRAADIVATEGGLITFAFCRVRPPESYTDDGDGHENLTLSIPKEVADLEQLTAS